MKRITTILLAALFAAACGVDTAPAPGTIEVLGPNNDGEFYVIGTAGAATPGTLVEAAARTTTEVVAHADGSFAAIVTGEIEGDFNVTADGLNVATHALTPEVVNINLASARGLEALPWVGSVRAADIAKSRQTYGLFSSLSDVTRVDGIGAGVLEAIGPYATADINVNAALKSHLMALPTIGDVRAEAIIAWRDAYGSFTQAEELMNVPGINTPEFNAIKDFITVGDAPSTFPGADLVNINKAGVDTLQELPGVGVARATAIVDFRAQQGFFSSKHAVTYVPGIGPATFERIRDLITVGVLDKNEGMFLGDAAWTYSDNGTVLDSGVDNDLVVTFHYGLDKTELVVTFVGGGACVATTDCAPVALKGLLDDSGDSSFSLLGFLPAGDGYGEFTVGYTPDNGGTLTTESMDMAFTAVRGSETYTLEMTAGRVLQ